ncbi:MAG: LysR family transcriptional regulator [Parvularculaceae bacterium]
MSKSAERLCWEDVEVFCLVAEHSSLRQAAAARGESYETVRRRINALEMALGERLFRRTAQGLVITTAGREILVKAREAHDAIAAIARRSGADRRRERRRVRLVLPEDIGALWLLPALAKFDEWRTDTELALSLEVRLEPPGAPIDWDAADIALGYAEPTSPELIRRRIARVGYAFYQRRDRPVSGFSGSPSPSLLLPGDDHPLLKQAPMAALLRTVPPLAHWRVNSAVAIRDFVVVTDAVGLLPSLAQGSNPELALATAPALPDASLDLWIGFHRDVGEVMETRALIDRLAALSAAIAAHTEGTWPARSQHSRARAFHES